jgi:hypothetical protein
VVRQLFLILPLFLPTLLYAAYAIARRRTAAGWWHGAPWVGLVLGGAILMAAGLIAFLEEADAPAGSVYVPAHVDDGRVVPGRFVAPGTAP